MADFGNTMAAEPHKKREGAPAPHNAPGPGAYDVTSIDSLSYSAGATSKFRRAGGAAMGSPESRRFRKAPGGDTPGPGLYRLHPALGAQARRAARALRAPPSEAGRGAAAGCHVDIPRGRGGDDATEATPRRGAGGAGPNVSAKF